MVETKNLDGREFVRWLEREKIPWEHGIMNLPDSAVTFLDTFRGMTFYNSRKRPILHVHMFVKLAPSGDDAAAPGSMTMKKNEADFQAEIRRLGILLVEKNLGCELENKECATLSNGGGVEVHMVRDVAPLKPMLCVSFRLPEEVERLDRIESWPAWEEPKDDANDDDERPKKKIKPNE